MSTEQFEEFEQFELEAHRSSVGTIIRQVWQIIRNIAETVIPAMALVMLIHLFLMQGTLVSGNSMEPNLHTNQRLIVEKLSYNSYLQQIFRWHVPEQGDIVVLNVPTQGTDPLIKRVVAVPGDLVHIHNGQVFVNGWALPEPYLHTLSTPGQFGPQTVPAGHIFVLGDNRIASNDSRNFGFVPLDDVVGRAWLSYWPLTKVGFVH